MNVIAVLIGGALGSIVRYGISLALPRTTDSFPWSTFLVNVLGSFVIGCLAGKGKDAVGNSLWLFLTVGMCGGFTTFSTFSIESIALLQHGRHVIAMTYVLVSVIVGLAAAWLGYRCIHGSA